MLKIFLEKNRLLQMMLLKNFSFNIYMFSEEKNLLLKKND